MATFETDAVGRPHTNFRDQFGVIERDGGCFASKRLVEEYVERFAGKSFVVGCAYDLYSDMFLMATRSNISYKDGIERPFPATIPLSDRSIYEADKDDTLNGPTDVAILEAGSEYAAVCGNRIIRLMYSNEVGKEGFQATDIMSRACGRSQFRGIAADSTQRLLFTYSFVERQILCIDADGLDKVISAIGYLPVPETPMRFGSVCFMAYNPTKRMLVTSDLGFGKREGRGNLNRALIRTFTLSESRQLEKSGEYFVPGAPPRNVTPGFIQYSSGILVDNEGWIVIGDADRGTLHLFDEQLRPKCVVTLPSGKHEHRKPYITGIALSATHAAIASSSTRQVHFYSFQNS
ncbi:unnamed protein product, partial [Mesorhabditis spiculigera]